MVFNQYVKGSMMKKICLGLGIAILLTGCISTKPVKTQATAQRVKTLTTENLIADPQFTEFRKNKGESKVWLRVNEKDKGLGNAGSSGTTAFDRDGSVRFRFMKESDDFTAQPGVYQIVKGLQPDTDYELSLYYNDKKGKGSISDLVFGVESTSGKVIASKMVHIKDLKEAPKGQTSRQFRQTFLSFNSGANTEIKMFAKLKINDASRIDASKHIGSQTEIRIDEVILIKE